MDNSNEMEAQLWAYIDGLCDEREQAEIQTLIGENVEWKAKYHELLNLHGAIGLSELEQPSLRFTKNVMEEIAKCHIAPAAKQYINNRVIYGIGIFFIAMIAGFLLYGVGQIDWQAASDSKSTLGVDLTKVDYSRMFDSTYMNAFMMLNVVLGLFLLDRFLANKRKKLVKEL